jgi:hypothetical protein
MEVFKKIKGYEGRYEISNQGRIKSITRNVIIKPQLDRGGYLRVCLFKDGKKTTKKVHRLVSEVFIGDIEGMTVNHKDFNKQNNRVSNLELITMEENYRHAYSMGRMKGHIGESSHRAKITEKQAKEVIRLLREKNTHKEIADNLDISIYIVKTISCGKRWKHLPR